MSILDEMSHDQRIDVKALRDIHKANGRGIIKAGQVAQLYKTISDAFVLGRDRSGNFTIYLDNPVEGFDFKILIEAKPFPEIKPNLSSLQIHLDNFFTLFKY